VRIHSLITGSLALILGAHGAAHPDLELQIVEVSSAIGARPLDAGLLLKRGDLYRRHGQWSEAEQDFASARSLDPGNPDIDWLEGRLFVDAGRNGEAMVVLTRFIESARAHSAAYRYRAKARWFGNDPQGAATDFSAAIENSTRPAPALYRSLAIAHNASGQTTQALLVIDEGLDRFPGEISLLGLAVDISTAANQTDAALAYLGYLPAASLRLPQWMLREALLECIRSPDSSQDHFEALRVEGALRGSMSESVQKFLDEMPLHPDPAACRSVALSRCASQKP
jgi:predicted Zn-dependent protease